MKTANIKDWFARIYPWVDKFKRLKKCKRDDGLVIRVYDAPDLPGCQSVLVVSEASDQNLIYQIQALDHVPETPDLKSLRNWQDVKYVGKAVVKQAPAPTSHPKGDRSQAKYLFDVMEFDLFGESTVGVTVTDKEYFDENGYNSDWHLGNDPVFEELGFGEEAEGFFSSGDENATIESAKAILNAHPDFYECPKYKAFLENLK